MTEQGGSVGMWPCLPKRGSSSEQPAPGLPGAGGDGQVCTDLMASFAFLDSSGSASWRSEDD